MSKLRTFFTSLTKRAHSFTLTTPIATIIGSIIIGMSVIAYGFIVRPTTPVVRDLVKEIAKDLKLKGSKWESCLTSDATLNALSEDYNDGVQAGVTGTPTTFILKKKGSTYETVARIEGAQDESYVRAAIEQALSASPKTTPFAGKQPNDTEFVQGTRSDVLVLEYADAECPFCIRFHPTVTKVMEDYGNRVGFTFRHFPLSNIHPHAVPYALAIECAGNLEGAKGYFSFIDKLFTEQANQ